MTLLPRRKCWLIFIIWCIAVWSMTYFAYRLQEDRDTDERFVISGGTSMTRSESDGRISFKPESETVSEQTSKNRFMNSTVIQAEMLARRALIQQYCDLKYPKHRGKNPYAQEYLRRIMVNRDKKIMFCFIPKIANTNFRRLFLHIQGLVTKEEVPSITGYEIYTKHLGNFLYLNKLTKKESKQLLHEYKKILFVREPLERLLSAYRNKYFHPNEQIRDEYALRYQEFYKNHPRVLANRKPIRTNLKEKPLTFREFLVYWTDSLEHKSYLNEHFVPTYELSNPCEVQYDYIGKYETLHKDVRFIFQTLGLDIEFPKRNDNYSASPTIAHVEHYYKEIPDRLFKRTWNFLQPDSGLFGYSLPEWALRKLK